MPLTESDLGELMTPVAAASFLDMSRSTIYRMIDAGEIDVVRVGSGRGRIRIAKRALLDHVNRHVTPAKANAPKTRGKRATATEEVA